MSRKNKTDDRVWNNIARIICIALAVPTWLSLVFVANFPDPLRAGATTSMLGYALDSGRLWPVFFVLLPLLAVCALTFFHARKFVTALSILLLLTAAAGYCYGVFEVFGDIGIENQPLIEDIAGILQPTFFFAGVLLFVFTQPRNLKVFQDLAKDGHLSPVASKVRDYLYPRFSEINYVTLAWCAALQFFTDPAPFYEFVGEDVRILIFPAAAIYLAIRMLGNNKFGYEAKCWIALTYYGFLSVLSMFSIGAQLDAAAPGAFHQLNLLFMVGFLVVSIVRFFTTVFVFRHDDPRIMKHIIARYSDQQHTWKEFVFVVAVGIVAFFILQPSYESASSLLLLTYAYTTLLHDLIAVRVKAIVLAFRNT